MRRRSILVQPEQTAAFPDMEFMLLRCPKFFASESLATVFPDAAALVSATAKSAATNGGGDANYYLLYTFQPSDYVLEAVDDADSQGPSSEDSFTGSPSGKANDDDFSGLIAYTPAAVEWKDRSRHRFFEFMDAAKQHIEQHLQASASTAFFMDWPDPATGLPLHSERGPSTFNDADVIQQFFSYNSVLIAGPGGGCRMVEHPRFGLNVYPAAGVLVAPSSAEAALCEAVRGLAAS